MTAEPGWVEGQHEPYTLSLWAARAGASTDVIAVLREEGLEYDKTIDGKSFDQVVATVPR